MKALNLKRNKSFQWSFGLHFGLLLLGFLPFYHHLVKPAPVEYTMEIGYQEDVPEVQQSGSEGLQARSPIYNEEPEPTMDQPNEQPIPVDESEPVEQTTVAENNAEVTSDVTTEETESDVAASETSANGTDTETHADGGGNGSPIEGNQDGAANAGDGGGGDGLEGDGIITRKIIHREDITQIAKVNGRVTLNICIDRAGRVISVAYDAEKTTITDPAIIKRASYLANQYRYEANYSAPARECGQLTFIFSIEDNVNKPANSNPLLFW
jgi:outer membrane biosynthesis protein TonB